MFFFKFKNNIKLSNIFFYRDPVSPYIGVKADDFLWRNKTFLPENIYMKNNKMPEFYMILSRKWPNFM